jgi:endonuclease G
MLSKLDIAMISNSHLYYIKGHRMKRIILAVGILTALCVIPSQAAQQTTRPISACIAQLPFGLPSSKPKDVSICREAYVLSHDNSAKIPTWVAYPLVADHAIGCEPRASGFSADQSLPVGQRSENSDYAKNGYDIGHMANAADMSWDPDVILESFILSNTAPQTANLNRGVWKMLETNIRAWAVSGRDLSIYIGGIWDKDSKTIGANRVVVPDHFYKIVVDNRSKEVLAFIFPNADKVETKLPKYLTSVDDIEQQSGITFPTPGDKSAIATVWPVDLKKMAADKRAACQ